MAEVYQDFYIDLDVKYSASNREIILKEDDTGVRFHMNITDDGEPVDLSGCRIVALFAGGKGIAAQDSSLDDSGVTINPDIVGRIDLDLFTSSFAVGYNECDIQVYSRDDRSLLITVPTFNFTVDRSHANEDAIVSRPEFPLLVNLVTQTEEALAAANEALENANEAIDRAENAIASTGDMTKSVYDTNDSGVVDDAEKLGGQAPSYYATAASVSAITPASIGAVPTTRTINGKSLSADIALTAADVSAVPTSQKGAASGVASLDANGKVEAGQATSRTTQITANTTAKNAWNGLFFRVNSSSDITITLPDIATVDDDFECEFVQWGTGSVTFALDSAASGTYLNSLDDAKTIAGRYGVVCLKKASTTTWLLAGGLG